MWFLLVLIFLRVPQGFAAPPASTIQPEVATYDELLHAIREARAATQTRVEQAVEREKVREAWEIGRLIDDHILLNKERADYGEQVMARLGRDLGMSLTELRYMVQFARAYPIRPTSGELSWSHYRDILAINDAQKRDELAGRAARENWTIDETRREIRKLQNENSASVTDSPIDEPLFPLKGELDTYRIVMAVAGPLKGKPVIDLGFSNYFELSGKDAGRFKEGDIIRVDPSLRGGRQADEAISLVKGATESLLPLQTMSYRAYLLEITDGDTIWVIVDLGLGVTTKQQLRLRGIDAPEIVSAEGQEAKRFVEKELKNAAHIVITSSRSDKYDRYLADVFYMPARNIKISAGSTRATGPGYETKAGEQYLNNRLLEEGLANRV